MIKVSHSLEILYITDTLISFQVWFQNRRAKFRRNERSALSSSSSSGKGLYSSSSASSSNIVAAGASGGSLSSVSSGDTSSHHFHPHSSAAEQPVLAKSVTSCAGQAIPSYATIWRPDMSKYAVIGPSSAAAANYRGNLTLYSPQFRILGFYGPNAACLHSALPTITCSNMAA